MPNNHQLQQTHTWICTTLYNTTLPEPHPTLPHAYQLAHTITTLTQALKTALPDLPPEHIEQLLAHYTTNIPHHPLPPKPTTPPGHPTRLLWHLHHLTQTNPTPQTTNQPHPQHQPPVAPQHNTH